MLLFLDPWLVRTPRPPLRKRRQAFTHWEALTRWFATCSWGYCQPVWGGRRRGGSEHSVAPSLQAPNQNRCNNGISKGEKNGIGCSKMDHIAPRNPAVWKNFPSRRLAFFHFFLNKNGHSRKFIREFTYASGTALFFNYEVFWGIRLPGLDLRMSPPPPSQRGGTIHMLFLILCVCVFLLRFA